MTSFLDYEGLKEYDNNNKNYINEKIPTLVAGNNITLTTDTDTNEITISSTSGGSGSSDASDINYDNTTSGLSATEVQSAIDELNGDLANYLPSVAHGYFGGVDLNTILTPGTYSVGGGSTALNFPSGVNGLLIVYSYSSNSNDTHNYIRQFYFRLGTIDSNDMNWYTRQLSVDGTKVGTWKKILNSDDLSSYSKLTYSSTEPTSNLTENLIWIG